jgi:hypothetical protein
MSKTITISIRVRPETRTWLERRTHKMGTAGSAAARIIEESQRKETYRGVDFRDTPDGRLAFVSETRVPVHLFARTVRDCGGNLREVASHYGWPLWKVESARAYAAAYAGEIDEDDRAFDARDDFETLQAILPALEKTVVAGER